MSNIGTRLYTELRGDRAIWAIVILLGIASILVVYSSTGTIAYQRGEGTQYYLLKHGLLVAFGFVVTYFAHLLHYTRYSIVAPYALLLSVLLLFVTLFAGVEINDARRWISIPIINLTFQTSDFAKIALLLYVARAISSKQGYIKDFKSAFLPIIVPVVGVCILIAPSDLSSALLLFFTAILLMVIGRVDLKYILLLFALGVAAFGILVLLGKSFPEYIRYETWASRLNEFVYGSYGDDSQIVQAKIAIAKGEWLGVGPGQSLQRNYLAHPYSDFIFASVCEEYGLLGGFFITFLYVALLFRAVRLVTNTKKAFGAMVALAMTLLIVIQALANIAVSVNLVPVTGLTLPLMSMGGTSMLFSSLAAGIILSVSKYAEQG